MGLVHAGFTFLGVYGPLEWGRWDNPLQKSKIAGLEGVAVVSLGRGSREFAVDIWICNNFASEAQLSLHLGQIEDHANVQGTLTRSGNINRTYQNIRFDSIDVDQEAIPSQNLGWFAIARLNFEQLRP
jgi:hypothetical protein